LIEQADLLVAMTDAQHDWPVLPRKPDLRVAGRSDLGERADADLAVSTMDRSCLHELVETLKNQLVPADDREAPGPWLFDPFLERQILPERA